MKPAVVFDLDGTLVDSIGDIANAANRMLADIGVDPLPQDVIKRFVGKGLPNLVECTLRHCNVPMHRHTELTSLTLEHYNAASSATTVPYPGVVQALDDLRRMGCSLGVCTNKPEAPAREVLKALNLSPYFEVVFGGDTLSTRKPDPTHLIASFEALSASGPRVFVGDSEVDAETSARADIPFLLFSEGYRKSPVSDIPHTAAYEAAEMLPDLVAGLLDQAQHSS